MTQQQQQHSCLNSAGRGIDESSRFNMASLKINLPQNHLKRRSRGGGGGLSRYYSGKARSFKCLNEVHSIEDLKKLHQDYNNIVVPPPAVAVAVDAHHHDSNNNNMNKKMNTFSSSSSFCSIGSFMSKEDIIKQHTLFYA